MTNPAANSLWLCVVYFNAITKGTTMFSPIGLGCSTTGGCAYTVGWGCMSPKMSTDCTGWLTAWVAYRLGCIELTGIACVWYEGGLGSDMLNKSIYPVCFGGWGWATTGVGSLVSSRSMVFVGSGSEAFAKVVTWGVSAKNYTFYSGALGSISISPSS